MIITSERLAHCFFRLNGFLTIANFVVHVDEGVGQRTDVDVLGVRFQHRQENQIRPMADHAYFVDTERLQVVLVETKRSRCRLNDAWTDPARGNLERVLRAGGFIESERVSEVAGDLYASGDWADDATRVRLVCAGELRNDALAKQYPAVPQLLWRADILPFIHERFWAYRYEKRVHQQWDVDHRELFRTVLHADGDLASFMDQVQVDEL